MIHPGRRRVRPGAHRLSVRTLPSCAPARVETMGKRPPHRASQAPETGEPSAANNGHIVAGQKDAGMVTAGTTAPSP
jgi:hypothetical protein